jgi:hypothetical protein
MNLLTDVLVGLASALTLGGIKAVTRNTGLWDGKIGAVIKPFQPVVVGVLAGVLPAIGNAIGITDIPSAQAVADAPTSAVAAIVIRECFSRWVSPLLQGENK